jgi:ankyrin repeat protein
MLKMLLNTTIDQFAKDAQKFSIISSACASSQGHQVLPLLLDRLELNMLEDRASHGRTWLHLAAECGNAASLAILLQRDSSAIEVIDFSLQTPLYVASAAGHDACAKLLLLAGYHTLEVVLVMYGTHHWIFRLPSIALMSTRKIEIRPHH